MSRGRLVFFGNERLATGATTTAPTLRALIAAGYDIAAIVSNYKPASSRKARPLEVETIATEHHIPLLLPAKLSDITDQLRDYQADAAVLIAYGKIVPQSIIDLFPRGIINLHPSLLPKHRGPIPIESVILGGEPATGVSLMQLARRMDAGPVYAQQTVQLTGHETKPELAQQLLELGRDLILEHLPAILSGQLTPTPQDDTQATYDQLIAKTDGTIDWSKPAIQLNREIRAYLGWPGSRAHLADIEVIVTAAHPLPAETSPSATGQDDIGAIRLLPDNILAAQTSDGFLAIDRLKPAGKRDMSAAEFLAGHPEIISPNNT